jgi:hypothetical protein
MFMAGVGLPDIEPKITVNWISNKNYLHQVQG